MFFPWMNEIIGVIGILRILGALEILRVIRVLGIINNERFSRGRGSYGRFYWGAFVILELSLFLFSIFQPTAATSTLTKGDSSLKKQYGK